MELGEGGRTNSFDFSPGSGASSPVRLAQAIWAREAGWGGKYLSSAACSRRRHAHVPVLLFPSPLFAWFSCCLAPLLRGLVTKPPALSTNLVSPAPFPSIGHRPGQRSGIPASGPIPTQLHCLPAAATRRRSLKGTWRPPRLSLYAFSFAATWEGMEWEFVEFYTKQYSQNEITLIIVMIF